MKTRLVFILLLVALACGVPLIQAEAPHMVGNWQVDITFPDGPSRIVGFAAQDGGEGSFRLLDSQAKVWTTTNPTKAKWTVEEEGKSVTFAGPMEFPLGNVGRESGTLVFKGKLGTDGSLSGEVTFSPLGVEQPSKHGCFKAVRVAGR